MRIKIGGEKGAGLFLSGGSFEGAMDGNLDNGSGDIENSVLGYPLGSEGGSDIGF